MVAKSSDIEEVKSCNLKKAEYDNVKFLESR